MRTLFDFEEVELTEDNKTIHDLVKENGGLTRNEISRNTGIRTDTVGFRLNDLKRLNKIKEGNKRECTVTERICKTYNVV